MVNLEKEVLREELKRALDVSSIEDSLPVEVEKVIVQMVEYNNPLRQNLPRKPGSGAGVTINRRTAASNEDAFVSDTDELKESTGSYIPVTFQYKTIGVQGKVTRKARAIGAKYIDILATEMESKAAEFKDKEDWGLIWGDSSADPKQFDGLIKLCPLENRVVLGNDATGGDLTLAKVDEAIDKVEGTPDMIICSKKSRRLIKSALQAYQRFVDKVEVRGGFKLLAYDDIPIFISSNVPNTCSISQSGSSGPYNNISPTGGNLTFMLFLDSSQVYVSELTPLTITPLAKVSSQFDCFDIYEDVVLVAKRPKAVSMLMGIR